jgi:hypothetical protein
VGSLLYVAHVAAIAIFLAFLLLVVANLIEIALYFASPTLLAALAVFPFEPVRQTELSPAAIARIANGPGYQGASAVFAPMAAQVPNSIVSVLGLGEKVDADTHVVHASPTKDEIVVRLAWRFLGGRSYGLVRFRLKVEQGSLRVHSAFLPIPFWGYVLTLPVITIGALAVDARYTLIAFVLVFAAGANSLFAWFRLKPLAQLVVAQLETDAKQLR